MHLVLQLSGIPQVKARLAKVYPDTKPTHRMEATARGLGYKTYAALLTDLNLGPIKVTADDEALCRALGVLAESTTGRPIRGLSRAVAKSMLAPVLDEHPELTQHGFDSIWHGSKDDLRKPIEEREAMFAERRKEAYESDWAADQFELALIFLGAQTKIKTMNLRESSYGLKHRAENLSREFGMFKHLGDYVSNGMLIAAAYSTGFSVKRIGRTSYNAYLNISSKTVNAARGGNRGSQTHDGASVRSLYATHTV
jgi:hypothetical protein